MDSLNANGPVSTKPGQLQLDVIFRDDLARFRSGDGPAPEHGHHPPYRAQSAVTGQAHDQPEEPTQARRLERRLPQNHHPPHSLTFKRFPCKGLASNMSGRYEPHQNRSRTVAHPTLELHAKVYAEQPGLFRTGLYINYLG